MLARFESLLHRVLRVPPEPDPPFGASASLQTFRAGKGYFRYRLAGWVLRQLGAILGIVAGLVWLHYVDLGDPIDSMLFLFEILAIVYLVAFMPFSFLMVSLDYRYRWYMVSDSSLRIREGLLKVTEKTMTFSNIQNLSIRQGPVQRFFGISDLEVRTAGGGGGSGGGSQGQDPFADELHTAYFRGVDNAEAIRDLVLGHLRRSAGAGLGDPDDAASTRQSTPATATATSFEALAAARELLGEVRALRGEAL